jgi:hypothetical protein
VDREITGMGPEEDRAMAMRYEKLDLEHLNEGRFLRSLREGVERAARELLEFSEAHGEDIKAKSSVRCSIEFAVRDETSVDIACDVSVTSPKAPKLTSLALREREQDGTPCLFARAGGTTAGEHPSQTVFCRKDGTPIPAAETEEG